MSHPENPKAAPEHLDADLFSGVFTVRIATLSPPQVITATITPLSLGQCEPCLTALVGWEGINTVSSSVGFDVEVHPGEPTNPWWLFLRLLSIVLGPETTPEPDIFGSGRWSSIVLATHELDGAQQHSVLVVVERVTATATLIRSDATRAGAEQAIPAALLSLEAGTVLVDMASRLILGRPWS